MPGSERPPVGWPGWPDGKKFAVVLTHDVEGKVGLERCRSLLKLEMDLGFKSSFNLIPEGDYRVPEDLLREIQESGFEVGVHDLYHDGRLFHSLPRFKRHAARINCYLRDWNAVGFRSGFMLHNLDWLHELNIKYDLSTFDTDPFEPQPEGRHTIFPFWVSRPPALNSGNGETLSSQLPTLNSRRAGYVELPYTLPQDSTLFILLREQTTDIWRRKVDWIAQHGGMVLVDTHPDYMNFHDSNGKNEEYPVRLYAELLEYLRAKYTGEYWHALPREVAKYASAIASSTGDTRVDHVGASAPLQRDAVTVAREREPDRPKTSSRLRGKHAAVLLFSYFPADPRPRRAAEALLAEGVNLEVICLQKDDSEARREKIGGVEVFRIPVKRQRGSKTRYFTQYSSFILRSFVRLTFRSLWRRYDFVHVHNMPDVLVFSALVPKALGAKIILDLHDPMPELMQTIFHLDESSLGVRCLKHLEKVSIGFADLAVTVNRACDRIFSSRSCSPEKITVVMNSPDDEVFQFRKPQLNSRNGSNTPETFSILYHGSLVPRNGFDLAVDALEVVRKRIPAAKLMVCGERSSFFDEVMESVQARGLLENVQYLGVKTHREIVDAINSCDLGVVPNQQNAFTEINTPTRIFEYLSLGKPVVAPRTIGITDYFGDQDLLFFEAGDSADLARQIEFAYLNREEVARMVDRGQQVYLANSWSRQKEGLIDAISALL